MWALIMNVNCIHTHTLTYLPSRHYFSMKILLAITCVQLFVYFKLTHTCWQHRTMSGDEESMLQLYCCCSFVSNAIIACLNCIIFAKWSHNYNGYVQDLKWLLSHSIFLTVGSAETTQWLLCGNIYSTMRWQWDTSKVYDKRI